MPVLRRPVEIAPYRGHTVTETTDYLVVGCGASAMAFVHVMLRETDANFTIVDKRDAPGGHWNDAYPFVRLHQPASTYGVASQTLGNGHIDQSGTNRGFYELSSGVEITNYYHSIMRDVFLASGRVKYYPMSEYIGCGEFVSLLSGQKRHVTIKRKLVDATLLTTSVPATHTRKFEVAANVKCIPPNELPRTAAAHRHFTRGFLPQDGNDGRLGKTRRGCLANNVSRRHRHAR